MLEKARAAKPVVVYRTTRTDLATAPCKTLVQRIIAERGEQAAAVMATKLNAELAQRGKGRVLFKRAVRNGNVHFDHAS
jgi:hypothetical protein